jgi:glycosyltransferase involved in cell wall biosynthesis
MIEPRVAVVSDTVDNIDGIAIGLRRLVAAATRAGHAMSLVGPASKAASVDTSNDGVVRIGAAMSASLPIYPDYTWSVPELPPLVAYLAKSADLVQIATPGPMGLAGLIAARMLGLPVIAQYHTEVAEFAAVATGLPFVRDLIGPFVGWFYQRADWCLAPSAAVEARLATLGVPPTRTCRVQRGVDLALFDPARRDRARFGWGDAPIALYVGRLSREKNLDALGAAWKLVRAQRPAARLVLVGECALPAALACDSVTALGALHGETLAAAFASADVFAFASETETFGNVVVEAAASGLPAVVVKAGAAHEHVIAGETGEIVAAGDRDAFAAAIVGLFDDGARRAAMSRAARAHALSYDLERAVDATWAIYRDVIANAQVRAA